MQNHAMRAPNGRGPDPAKRFLWRVTTPIHCVVTFTMLGALSGCSNEVDPDIRALSQAAAVGNDWRGRGGWESPGEMDICFIQKSGQAYDSAFAATIEEAIRAGWERAIGLDLDFNGECPTTFPDEWVSIFMNLPASGGGAAEGGVGGRQSPHANWDNRNDVQVALWTDSWSTIQHEFGHVLGFYHEHERADADECPGGVPPGNTSGFLTSYDGNSIMDYCGSGSPTYLDLLAAETLYPKNYARELRCLHDAAGCFNMGDGVVFSGHSSGVAGPDWYARGQGNLLLTFDLALTKSGVSLGSLVDEVSASNVTSGKTTVAITVEDPNENLHSSTRFVRESPGLYVGILSAVL